MRVFDDYAHHPTEISATLAAVRTLLEQSGAGRIAGGVSAAFVFADKGFRRRIRSARWTRADEVFVLDVYGAREQPLAGVSGASVAEHVSVAGALPARFLGGRPSAVAAAAGPATSIVTMGAGDVTMLGPEIVDRAAGAGRPQRARAPGRAAVSDPSDADDAGAGRPPTPRRCDEPADENAIDRAPPTNARRRRTDAPTSREVEGPRRRARRERAERRAAQARAEAIEEARREAKRRRRAGSRRARNPLRAAPSGA